MSFTATVQDNTIKLPPGVHLANGTKVSVEAVEGPSAAKPSDNALAWMDEFAGAIETLPSDFAERHDDYIHGRKRRIS